MELDFAFIADAAQVVGGRLYTVGGVLERIWSAQVPVVHPSMTLALRLALTPAEAEREHQLEVVLLDADGKAVSRVSGKLKVERNNEQAWRPVMPLMAISLIAVKFERFGAYALEILVNGSSLKSLPLELLQRANPAALGKD